MIRTEELQGLEDLFCCWNTLREARLAAGHLRPSHDEAEAFSAYVDRLETLDPDSRSEWDLRRNEIECRPSLPRCDCGHPEALHVEGSCFAMVGCSTSCHCSSEQDRNAPETPSSIRSTSQ